MLRRTRSDDLIMMEIFIEGILTLARLPASSVYLSSKEVYHVIVRGNAFTLNFTDITIVESSPSVVSVSNHHLFISMRNWKECRETASQDI